MCKYGKCNTVVLLTFLGSLGSASITQMDLRTAWLPLRLQHGSKYERVAVYLLLSWESSQPESCHFQLEGHLQGPYVGWLSAYKAEKVICLMGYQPKLRMFYFAFCHTVQRHWLWAVFLERNGIQWKEWGWETSGIRCSPEAAEKMKQHWEPGKGPKTLWLVLCVPVSEMLFR